MLVNDSLSLVRPPARSRRRIPALVLSLLLAGAALGPSLGCRPQARTESFDPDSAAAHAAKLERWLARHPDDVQARVELAHVYWLHLADAAKAIEHLDRVTGERPALGGKKGGGLAVPPALARFSRAAIAQSRLDVGRAALEAQALLREIAAQPSARARAQARALAAPAARLLDAGLGLRPGDRRSFVAFFDGLDLGPLSAEAREQLLSTRAAIARISGEDYRDYYTRQGCVQDWAVGELEGFRGALELDRLALERPFASDAEAVVTPLSCAVRIWNDEPRAAIRRLRASVEVPGETLRLSMAAQNPTRVYVDDALVWASDRSDRYPLDEPGLRVPVSPGTHRVEVQTSIPGERAWVLVRATDADGEALTIRPDAQAEGDLAWPADADVLAEADALVEIEAWDVGEGGRGAAGKSLGLAGPIYAPLRAYLALGDALADGDSDRAERVSEGLRDRAEAFAEAHLMLADFELRDPSRGRTNSAARQQAELELALALDPSMAQARLALLSMRLARGEEVEVLEALEALDALPTTDAAALGRDSLSFALLRYEAYRRRGGDFQAERALEHASAIHPGNCEVLMARRELARERNQVAVEAQIVEALAECPGSLGLRARLAVERERLDEAEALWREQLTRVPDDIDAMAALAEIAVTAGRYDEATGWHREILGYTPYRALSQIELADLAASRGGSGDAEGGDPRAARELVLAAIERFPHSSRLREIGERVGIPDPLMGWRIDGREALADYQRDRAEGLASEGVSEVLLLDREVSVIYPDLSHRHIVHQMFHILSDQAIDAHGEFENPGAELLTMHSIKPDGSIVEPELIPGKAGLSLRGLEIGDIVELEFTYEAGPELALPGHADLGRFRFQSAEIPFHRSELIVLAPASMDALAIEARNDAPVPSERRVELVGEPGESSYRELTFRADQVPRLGAEPASRSMLDELPMIQAHVPLKIQDWLDNLAVEIRPGQRSNPELRATVAEICAGYDNDYDKLDALWRWVVDEIEEAGDLTVPATVTFSARQGSRLMLLRAMLEVAGVDSELWLLRDRFGPRIYDGPTANPLVEAYDTAMLALQGPDGQPLLVGTSSEVVPIGYLSPSYAEGEALRVQLEADEPAPGRVEVPANPAAYRDLRRWELELTLDAEGRGSLRGTIELRGLEAILWRDAFEQVDADKIPEVFAEAELRRILPVAALDLGELEFENQWELEQPLIVHFTASVRNGGVVQGGQLATLAATVPLDLATGYTRLPSRWSGLVIGYAPILEAKVSVQLDGRTFSQLPADVALEGARGRYTRTLVEGGEGSDRVVLESRSVLEPGIVELSDYRALAQYANSVQAAEQQLLIAR
ncbi:hypothetical protein G6O69_26810 [Pseudenhygromyxa sp. WMMC2535]|uniref:hypothetical protein n=1 Tax=Pseudenhygromyxa sp. WMMC2535 TaxID=2712867 RepID=UPI0015580E18|nr:hypothetical protein [Pseudenhygromyxa sp. WMMC2535]NVB41478.1 hypothetical protein [Pseudenhygromyxa sp. WMMC2535]